MCLFYEYTRRSPDEEDDLSEVRADAVPPEVRAWLASTFTRQLSTGHRKPGEEKPKFRSVAQAIRAGILVERIYRRMSSSSFLQFPAEVARHLKVSCVCLVNQLESCLQTRSLSNASEYSIYIYCIYINEIKVYIR